MKKLFTLILIAVFVLPTMAQTPPPMPSKEKKLNLTVFLQGLYISANANMKKAQDFVAGSPVDKFSGTIADVITVELHDAVNYAAPAIYSVLVNLNQDGTANTGGKTFISIPNTYSGSYYITVKHRNHIETTTAAPVSFTDAIINCNFTTTITKAFGSNMKEVATGVFGLYVGDLNSDGFVNGTDLSTVNASVLLQNTGYTETDVNGDGYVNGTDLSTVNAAVLQQLARVIPIP